MRVSNRENDRALAALADEVNAAHLMLSELGVPAVLEGDDLSLPERIAWLNLTRPAVPAPASGADATDGGRPARSQAEEPAAQPSAATDEEWMAETDGVMWGVTPKSAPMLFRLCESEEAARELAARWNAEEAEA